MLMKTPSERLTVSFQVSEGSDQSIPFASTKEHIKNALQPGGWELRKRWIESDETAKLIFSRCAHSTEYAINLLKSYLESIGASHAFNPILKGARSIEIIHCP